MEALDANARASSANTKLGHKPGFSFEQIGDAGQNQPHARSQNHDAERRIHHTLAGDG